MAHHPSRGLDLGELLAAVEDAPPVAAADVLGQHLVEELGAREVSFLIADSVDERSSGSATRAAWTLRALKAAKPPSGCRWRTARKAAR